MQLIVTMVLYFIPQAKSLPRASTLVIGGAKDVGPAAGASTDAHAAAAAAAATAGLCAAAPRGYPDDAADGS